MPLQRLTSLVFLCGAIVLGATAAVAQNYPDKPIRIVAQEPGGGNDFVARLIAQGLTTRLGQQVIVDNRGVTGGSYVAKSKPDGYTLLNAGGQLWLEPFLRKVDYDTLKDFAPVTLALSKPGVLVLNPSVLANSVSELITLAKAKPGTLNTGYGAVGGLTHLSPLLFKSMSGANIVTVPYKGNGPAINGLIGGEVQIMFATSDSITPHIKSHRVKALAVTTEQKSALFPDLPTIASTLPGFEVAAVDGIVAPAGVPSSIVARLNREIVAVLNQPDTKKQFFDAGNEVIGTSSEQFSGYIKAEMVRMGKVITDAGIRPE